MAWLLNRPGCEQSMVVKESTKDEDPSTSSDQFQPAKEVRNFDGGVLVRIGTMRSILAYGSAKLFSNRSVAGFCRIGGAHQITPGLHGAFFFEGHHDARP